MQLGIFKQRREKLFWTISNEMGKRKPKPGVGWDSNTETSEETARAKKSENL